ncbi:E3 ubiquitin/ISG15 ligase TRIM25-like isoform X2 [Lissotriton helveticus]
MAASQRMSPADLGGELNCSICLTLYQDPVRLSCGHDFCKSCIRNTWDHQKLSGLFRCPDCSKTFHNRPHLRRNWKLSNMVNFYRYTRVKKETGPELSCTYCLGLQSPAMKLCLQCEMLLCEKHLRKHNERAAHVLADPATPLESRRCPSHGELLSYYCVEENEYLCVSCCLLGQHRNHKIHLLSEASDKNKSMLRATIQKLSAWRDDTKQRIDQLMESVRDFSKEIACLKANASALFSDFRRQLTIREQQVLEKIDAEEAKTVLQMTAAIQELEGDQAVFTEKILQLVELCAVQDPLALQQRLTASDVEDKGESSFEDGGVSNASCEDNIELNDSEDCSQKDSPGHDPNIYDMALTKKLCVVTLQTALNNCLEMLPQLKSIRGFNIQGSTDLLLDVSTAASKTGLVVSKDLKTASHSTVKREFIVTRQQFTDLPQVLSSKIFPGFGQYYWEVETSDTGQWAVGVAYPCIKRSGKGSALGWNADSWCLNWNNGCLTALHDSHCWVVNGACPSLLGIHLNCDSGELSFYSISDSIMHIHTFTEDFTELLHPAFFVDKGASIKIKSLPS